MYSKTFMVPIMWKLFLHSLPQRSYFLWLIPEIINDAVLIEWTNMLPPLCMHMLQQGHFIELKQGCAGLPNDVNKCEEAVENAHYDPI